MHPDGMLAFRARRSSGDGSRKGAIGKIRPCSALLRIIHRRQIVRRSARYLGTHFCNFGNSEQTPQFRISTKPNSLLAPIWSISAGGIQVGAKTEGASMGKAALRVTFWGAGHGGYGRNWRDFRNESIAVRRVRLKDL
jgi:hypothetical protein